MRGLAFWFFISAMLYGLGGVAFGLQMATAHDHSLAAVQGHLNGLGCLAMGLFGLYYNAVPQAGERLAARLHFLLSTIGLWLLIPGAIVALNGGPAHLASAGLVVTGLATLLFAAIVVRHRRPVSLRA
ncbi:hypothetical protein GWI72_18930 [Microvirga tunisiensis]|uniref:Uncharacterized protein n=2 Tax=Pannonibacter tanglangensis TaxID=2750084 RepID=A0ABW9ZPM1_9HYPH|nr:MULTISPECIES: hypothetical protein [unclassified Pannonibacter]NBN65842.1 hypothetical protein [Pannonibacter sp. XCT-34]NBN80360.1 hypothetical protein [Pannonibacter sp. XCT-53]